MALLVNVAVAKRLDDLSKVLIGGHRSASSSFSASMEPQPIVFIPTRAKMKRATDDPVGSWAVASVKRQNKGGKARIEH
jgi:hypothetical protein